MADWKDNLVKDDEAMRDLLEHAHRIAVLGIKPEDRADAPAHSVPAYLQRKGYEIVPVPVYYPEVKEILGEKVYRSLEEVPGAVDVVEVFRKSEDIPPHLPDLLAKRPRAVWFQLGIRNDEVAEALAREGIQVVQDHCMKVEHRRLLGD